ncbi:MAG: CHASE2 domain-containing protein [Candidatus Omnitrophica bacterium]|nr:CHASE2 domain-containing protein [Candidatus Omnitrophota bacterium]MBU4488149.1 CHASE2 domain-containing protein [Candidatus Omnitrophota bacterium]MCG2704536.1 CHASE2 domain-containing protein [Candidatus Omnitrophota bacterium]
MGDSKRFSLKSLMYSRPKDNSNIGQRIIFRSPLFPVLIAVFIAAIYLYSTFYFPPVKIAKLKFNDYFFRMRHSLNSIFNKEGIKSQDIVLVTIDEESYERLEKRWPWERDVFADFIDKISEYGPGTIALDFALYGHSPNNSEADAKLADAIKRSGNVIIASVYGKEKLYLGPYDIFAKASKGYGVIGAERDADSAIRRIKAFALILAPQKGGDMSFEVKAAASYLGIPYDRIIQESGQIIIGDKSRHIAIPADDNGSFLINYMCDKDDVETVPVWRIMAGKVAPQIFKNKLVLVSQTGEIFHDLHLTPLGYRSGGLIIANVLKSIVNSSYMNHAEPKYSALLISFFYLLAFLLFYRKEVIHGFSILIFMMVVYASISFTFFLNGIVCPTFDVIILLPALFLGITFYKYTLVVLEGQEVKKLAITDSLTSLYTHRYFRFLLEHVAKTTINTSSECSLIIIKLLNLDRIIKDADFNEGQRIQRKIAENIIAKLPKSGYGAYLGIGEFGMLLPRVGIGEALGIAGGVRNNIRETDFAVEKESLKPTVAVGVSEINRASFPKTASELMRGARAAMLRAKEIGYNKIYRFNPKIDVSVFEAPDAGKTIKDRLDGGLTFLAADLEERNKELEDLLQQLSTTQKDLEEAHFETLRSLIVALEEKDPCTAGHSERVGEYAEKIAQILQMPEEELKILRQAAILHDIGKVGIPPDILRKEDVLSAGERYVIQLHPEFSVKILSTSKYFNKHINAIRDHHERLDGSGYPRGLKEDQISLAAQIIAVCDVFDAMSTNRPYRKALSYNEALQEMVEHPEKYNKKIVSTLENILKSEHKI